VTGVDFSGVQIERARRLVPAYRSWLEQAGLSIVSEDLVPDGASAHTLFWARRS
jgi:hypothetical protein